MGKNTGLALGLAAAAGIAGIVIYSQLKEKQQVDSFLSAFGGSSSSIGSALSGLTDSLGSLGNISFPDITSGISSAIPNLNSVAGNLGKSLTSPIQDAVDSITKRIAETGASLTGGFSSIFSNLPKLPTGQDLGKGANDFFSGVGTGVGTGFADVFTSFFSTLSNFGFQAGQAERARLGLDNGGSGFGIRTSGTAGSGGLSGLVNLNSKVSVNPFASIAQVLATPVPSISFPSIGGGSSTSSATPSTTGGGGSGGFSSARNFSPAPIFSQAPPPAPNFSSVSGASVFVKPPIIQQPAFDPFAGIASFFGGLFGGR